MKEEGKISTFSFWIMLKFTRMWNIQAVKVEVNYLCISLCICNLNQPLKCLCMCIWICMHLYTNAGLYLLNRPLHVHLYVALHIQYNGYIQEQALFTFVSLFACMPLPRVVTWFAAALKPGPIAKKMQPPYRSSEWLWTESPIHIVSLKSLACKPFVYLNVYVNVHLNIYRMCGLQKIINYIVTLQQVWLISPFLCILVYTMLLYIQLQTPKRSSAAFDSPVASTLYVLRLYISFVYHNI